MPVLIVTTPATSFDLTRLATVKAELGITDRKSDALLKGYISQASDAVAQFCNRVFAIETVTETFRLGHAHQPLLYQSFRRDHHTSELILKRYPVIAVASVTENDVLLDATMYETDPNEGTLRRLCSDQPSFWAGGKTVVVYSSGFTLPTGLPSGIERAAIMLVKQYVSSGDRDLQVRTERVDGAGTTEFFNSDGTGLPPDVQGLLAPHIKPNG
jgi:hypothetical protein